MTQFHASSVVVRNPVHPTINEEQIATLVDRFYERIMADGDLGPIFREHAGAHWDRHLDTMKRFWRSVLLRTGEYKGKPVPVHQKIDNVEASDFEQWLFLFKTTTAELFEPEAALLVNAAAARIATSLWLARNSDPFVTPPDWQDRFSGDGELQF